MLTNFFQDNHTGCQDCARRSDWDFLKTFYQREETAKQQIQSLNNHVVQLNGALYHAGRTSQKDRVALNKAHEHLQEIQNGFSQSETARAKLENQLHEERQELLMCRENLDYERHCHTETSKSLDCIWTSHNRLGDIMAKLPSHNDDSVRDSPYVGYNVTDLVFELTAKSQRLQDLEADMVQKDHQYHAEISQLKERLQVESAQHTEDFMNQAQRINELDLIIRHQTEGPNSESKPGFKSAKRRRHSRGKGKSSKVTQTEDPVHNVDSSNAVGQDGANDASTLPVIKEEEL